MNSNLNTMLNAVTVKKAIFFQLILSLLIFLVSFQAFKTPCLLIDCRQSQAAVDFNLENLIKNCNPQTFSKIKIKNINFNADLIEALKESLDGSSSNSLKNSLDLKKIQKNIEVVFKLLNSLSFKFSALMDVTDWLLMISTLAIIIFNYFLIKLQQKIKKIIKELACCFWHKIYYFIQQIYLNFLLQNKPVQSWCFRVTIIF